MFTLRPYQQQAVDACLTHFRQSNDAAVIVLPTGAGKSLVIAELARLARKRILILTHVKELVEQNHLKFRQYGDQAGIKSGVYSAGLNLKQTDNQVTFASIQSVARNLAAFEQYYSLVIVDECHRIGGLKQDDNNQYQQVVSTLTKHNKELKILGLTATPYRTDKGWIYQRHYQGIQRSQEPKPFKLCIYELPLAFMIKKGYLTQPNLVDAPVAQYDFSALQSNQQGLFNENEVNQLLVKYPRVTQAIIEQVQQLSEQRKGVMIFAATVKHAQEIVSYLPNEQTALITGDTDNQARAQLISQFKAKELKYLVNVSVLTTGFDAPHVDVIAILRPTESVSLYQQIVGRGLRLADDKKDCLVIDYAGNGINIYYPEIGEKKPNHNSELVQVFCPACGFANSFWGIKDQQGKVIEHYGRKCQGIFLDEEQNLQQDCDYRFVYKECPHCNFQNDIAARTCQGCEQPLQDPDDKLKAALKLKNALVLRCSGLTADFEGNKLTLTYYDEDGTSVKEKFDFNNKKQTAIFNRDFGQRFNGGMTPTQFSSAEQVADNYLQLTAPDFVVARKKQYGWQIQDKLFDYQGNYRKANQLR